MFKKTLLLSLLILVITLTGCANFPKGGPTATATISPTFTPLPTLTQTPPPPLLVLVAPSGSDASLLPALQPVLEELAQANSLEFSLRNTLTEQELSQQPIRLAVLLPPGVDAAGLANTAPQTQFLAVGMEGLLPQDNLSLLEAQPYRADWEGFAAGYIAAVVTPDWRVGVIADAGSVEGKAAQNAFANGVRFMCGLCQPLYPPFPIPTYPLTWQLTSASSPGDVDAAIAYFKEWAVKTVYLHRPQEEWLSAFGSAGFNLIAATPPPQGMNAQWVVSLQSVDLAQETRALVEELLEGKGGQVRSASLTLTNVNEQLFSPGKQAYVMEMLNDLLAGLIDTGVDLTSGENR